MRRRYSVIYADPPWKYDCKALEGCAENHYPTMSVEEICKLPVEALAANDSLLFLWATYPQLKEALQVVEAWGFTYKTCAFTWIKKNKIADSLFYGLGFWTRGNAEVCLLATRGKPTRTSNSVFSIIQSPVAAHSEKPDEARRRIVELVGDVPRLELFARKKYEGWDVWGNEVSSNPDVSEIMDTVLL